MKRRDRCPIVAKAAEAVGDKCSGALAPFIRIFEFDLIFRREHMYEA
jgi:hypothetical protein